MKYQYFIHKKKIEPYFEKHYFNQKAFYSIVKWKRYYFFFTRWTVLFYDEKDLINKIREVAFELLEKEFNIQIRSLHCDFVNINHQEIHIHLKTDNDALLVGKFGQNQRSLETYLSKAISFYFKKKYEFVLHFVYSNKRKKFSAFNPQTNKNQNPINKEIN